jgi:hypothetical protein
MYQMATRLIARSSAARAIPRATAPSRRFISTAPPTQKSRSWKSSAARWGVAGAIIYYYNTTDVFAEEPTCKLTKSELYGQVAILTSSRRGTPDTRNGRGDRNISHN